MAGYVIFFVLLVALWLIVSSSKGNQPFWKATRRHPEIAWAFFNSHPHWYIEDKPNHVKVIGPFFVKNPLDGRVVKVYCDESYIDSSQRDFMLMINSQ